MTTNWKNDQSGKNRRSPDYIHDHRKIHFLNFSIMKNLFLYLTALGVSWSLSPSCQKTPPPASVTQDNDRNLAVSDRSCTDCNLTLYVEVADWDDVNYIYAYYPNPANPSSPLVKVFTSATPSSYSVCSAVGDVTFYISGGPAAAYARADDVASNLYRIFYFVYNGSGTATCTAELIDCGTNTTNPWQLQGCGGTSQG